MDYEGSMQNLKIKFIIIGSLLLSFGDLFGQSESDTLLTILNKELNREWEVLSKAKYAAYYMDYRVDDNKSLQVSASFGKLMESDETRYRIVQPTIRIGNYEIDNTRQLKNQFNYNGRANTQSLPLNNDAIAIQNSLWMVTNREYQSVKDVFAKIASHEVESEVNDFSKEEPSVFYEPPVANDIDVDKWNMLAKELSNEFELSDGLTGGDVYIYLTSDRQYFVSSEGSSIAQNSWSVQIHMVVSAINEEKESMDLYESFHANSVEGLPSLSFMKAKARELVKTINELKMAPSAEPYTGPAILHPRASAVFFHEIFGHRIEGHRLKSEYDGQTFKEKIGEKILPDYINIYSDPTLSTYENAELNGHYNFDDQGIKARRVNVVKDGELKSFLMSRAPLEEFQHSNGHGRSQIGASPVARQSNLIIETDKGVSEENLRKQLIEECKKQGKPYGYYFVDVTGGFTNTSRYQPNAFNIMPTIVYRIFVDGRPDELVRGVDLIGTPLSMFAEVVATGNQQGVFNGTCGAESGGIPVSAVAPSILVRRIETQKKPVNEIKSSDPLLPSP